MTAKQCGDSETNIKVEKQPNGRVRVVIEDLSIAGNMMDVEEGVLQYLNRAGTAIIREALQQHDVEGDPLVWDSRCQALILNNSIFLPFFLILLILLFDLQRSPSFRPDPRSHGPPRAGSVKDGRRQVVHLRAAISRPLLDGPRARRQARSASGFKACAFASSKQDKTT